MRCIKILAAICITCYVTSSVAASLDHRFYIGLDGQYNYFKVDTDVKAITLNGQDNFIKTEMAGGSVKVGYRWTKFGFEFGYTVLAKETYTGSFSDRVRLISGDATQNNSNTYFDVYYYRPFTNKLDLKLMLGVGRLRTQIDGLVVSSNGTILPGNSTSQDTAGRIGAGVQYAVMNNISIDAMYKLQGGNEIYDSMSTLAFGISYHL